MSWPVAIPKEDGRAPFFWYDTDILEFFEKKIIFLEKFYFYLFIFERSVSYQKKGGRRPSFGMTPTQAIRDLFM